MINQKDILKIVKEQLAVDYNCISNDFDKDGLIFTLAKKENGRRHLPFIKPRCEMITMGKSLIINVSNDVMPFVKKRLQNKNKYDAMNSKFVYGMCYYYLPCLEKLKSLDKDNSYKYKIIEQPCIHNYYKFNGFKNALQYNKKCETPEILGVVAFDKEQVIGIACATADSEKMCQIGVDVLENYRNQGVAKTLVNKLTCELLNRDKIPYYFTDNTNLASQKTAIASGYLPAWIHSFKSRLYKSPFKLLNYLKF